MKRVLISMEEIEERAKALWDGLGVESEVIKILQREYGLSQIRAKGILRRARRHLRKTKAKLHNRD